jgi:predicted dehydrogenase
MKTKRNVLGTALTRRDFLKAAAATAAAGIAAPYVLTSSALGGGGKPPASDRIGVGHIGVGGQGGGLMGAFLGLKDCQVIGVADCFQDRREGRTKWANERYGGNVCTAYRDFRDLLARKDVDAVCIATPDHWHVLAALAAAKAGKDMYVEKPLGLCIQWDQAIRDAVHQYGCMFQYGTQQRSSEHCRFGCELVLNGRIGQLKSIEVHAPAGTSGGSTKPIPVPEGLDYDTWLGPAPVSAYTSDRCTSNGTWHVYDNAIGFLAGWGAHPLDIMVWPFQKAGPEKAVPCEIEGTGKIPTEGLYDTVTNWDIRGRFADGVDFKFIDGGDLTIFTGTEGKVSISRGGLTTEPASLKTSKIGPDGLHLVDSRHHQQNLLDAVRTRVQPVSNIDDAIRSDIISHLSDIAIRTGRKIKWDPKAETIVGDEQASRMTRRALRAPWRL